MDDDIPLIFMLINVILVAIGLILLLVTVIRKLKFKMLKQIQNTDLKPILQRRDMFAEMDLLSII